MTCLSELPELAEVLSPFQLRCFMDCQARWWFKYDLRYPDPPTGKFALGRAVHIALAQNFEQKIETYEDLPLPGVAALFRQAWALEREQTEFRDDEDPAELALCGENLVRKYIDELAPTIEPPMHVEGKIASVLVQGWIDLLDVNGRIIDIKTSARKPRAIAPEQRFQIATYAQLTPGATGDARIDTLVKTKAPGLLTQRVTITGLGYRRNPHTVSACASDHARGRVHAEPPVDELLTAELFLLARVRTGVGRRGPGVMKPLRDPRYLAWIRTLPCVVCRAPRGIEASHTSPMASVRSPRISRRFPCATGITGPDETATTDSAPRNSPNCMI
jgi:hypothetical protein